MSDRSDPRCPSCGSLELNSQIGPNVRMWQCRSCGKIFGVVGTPGPPEEGEGESSEELATAVVSVKWAQPTGASTLELSTLRKVGLASGALHDERRRLAEPVSEIFRGPMRTALDLAKTLRKAGLDVNVLSEVPVGSNPIK